MERETKRDRGRERKGEKEKKRKMEEKKSLTNGIKKEAEFFFFSKIFFSDFQKHFCKRRL